MNGCSPTNLAGASRGDSTNAFNEFPHVDELPARASVIAEGHVADHLFSIREGMVRIYRTDARGRSKVVGFLFSGDFVGIASRISERYRYSAETVLQTTLCRWPRRCIEALLAEVPATRRLLFDEVSNEMSLIQQRMAFLDRPSAAERVAAYLLKLAERLATVPADGNGGIRCPFHDSEIADYLNLSPESLIQTLKAFQNSRAIRRHEPGAIEILDKPALNALVYSMG